MGRYLALCLTLALFGCGNSGQPAVSGGGEHQAPVAPNGDRPDPPAPIPVAEPAKPAPIELGVSELGIDGIDPAADPCSDFYRYACGNWKPADAGIGSRLLEAERATEVLLAGELAADKGPAGALYRQCGQAADRQVAGLAAAQPLFDAIAAVKKSRDIGKALGVLHRARVWAGFSATAAPDFADGRRTILHIDRGGLTLGDRDRYLDAKDAPDRGENFVKLRKRYRVHIARTVQAAGRSAADAKRIASDVLRFERELAKMVRSSYERRSPQMLVDRVAWAELAKVAARIDWASYLMALGAPQVDAVNLTDRRGLRRLDRMTKTLSPSVWRHYLEWQLIYGLAPYGPSELVAARRELDGLVGTVPAPVDPCAVAVSAAYPDLTGDLIAAKRLPADQRARAEALVAAMISAHGEAMRAVGWLTRDTREKAAAKLVAIDVVIGVPDWLRGARAAAGDGYLATILAARERETTRQLATLGTEAGLSFNSTRPGARYEWLGNRLVLAAGGSGLELIRADRPVAAALGVLGTTAGHGVAMATNDQGGRWSSRGALQAWWTEADIAGFRESSACVLASAKASSIDGAAILSRARADRAGIEAAYRAYRGQPAEPGIRVRGATADQLFFLAAASSMCSADPDAGWRVQRAMADIPAFAAAFQCKVGSPMSPAKRCR